jgi:hypothetical protein
MTSIRTLCAVTLFTACWGLAPLAKALPSYARQTGLPCSGCHTTPPELNAGGRQFKLMGYVDRAKNNDIISDASRHNAGLQLLGTLPLSAFLESSFTSTKAPQGATQNGNFEFPQDIALFFAGAWSQHLGSFVQVTFDGQSNTIGIDNTDIRFANKGTVGGKDVVYGLMLNNNPTVEDLWNSTPAWGFPFIANDSAPGPSASALINGGLGLDVAGIGAYTMIAHHLYAAGTLYRSDHIGSPQPTDGAGMAYNIRGVAPYWRVAWQQASAKNYLEVGAYGIHAKSTPGGITGAEDTYTDFGPDFQYDRILGKDVLSIRGTYIHENAQLDASQANEAVSPGSHHLNTGNANVEYHYGNHYSAAVGGFMTEGTTDALLYPQGAITGSANGDPRSSGFSANLSYWPLQNLDLGVQYTGYTRFNGTKTNYDGLARNASDNNTVYLLARFLF